MKKRFLAAALSIILSVSLFLTDAAPALAQGIVGSQGVGTDIAEESERVETKAGEPDSEVLSEETEEKEDSGDTGEEEATGDMSEETGGKENSEETSEQTEIPENSEESPEEDETSEDSEEAGNGEDIEETETSEEELEEELFNPEGGFTEEQLKKQEEGKAAFEKLARERLITGLIYLTEVYELKKSPDYESKTLADLPSGTTLELTGVDTDRYFHVWYRVNYYTEEDVTEGYVLRDYLVSSSYAFLEWEEEYLDAFLCDSGRTFAIYQDMDEEVAMFPASYREKLSNLKEKHPNWHFVPFRIEDVTLSGAVEEENKGNRNLVQKTSPYYVEGSSQIEPGWYLASKEGIRHYLDPKNFLTENDIFQFEALTFNPENAKLNVIEQILQGSFMANPVPGDDTFRYSNYFLQGGIESNVNPYHLAARVKQEQGNAGTSPLISGTYAGYEGYYNFFNINAYGKTKEIIYQNGLSFAKEQGWNNRYKSIVGGSAFLGKRYILIGQDTLYLQKFDFIKPYYTHQYMQNLSAAYSEASTMRKAYVASGSLNNAFVFKIPVFKGEEYSNVPLDLWIEKQEIGLNSSDKITIKAGDEELPASHFNFTSTDSSVITIDENGMMKSYDKCGTVTVKAAYKGPLPEYNGKVLSVNVTVYEIKLLNVEETIRKGTQRQITLEYALPAGIKNQKVTYFSSDVTVLTVDSKGLITAQGVGVAEVTIGCSSYQKKQTFYVFPYGFEWEEGPLKINAGEEAVIELLWAEEDIRNQEKWPEAIKNAAKVTFSSSDENVVEVDSEGTLKAVSCGRAVITAQMECGFAKTREVNVPVRLTFINETFSETRQKYVDYQTALNDIPEGEERNGWHFAGWYSGKDGAGVKLNPGDVFLADRTFYAHYVETGEDFFVLPIGQQVYTGKAIKPQITVYDGEFLLTQGKDYTVEYTRNVNAGTALVKIKGKGNYSGTQTTEFEIVKKEISEKDVTATVSQARYTGKEIKTKPVLTYQGKKLVLNKDYTLLYEEISENAYVAPGFYSIKAVGMGNFTGTLEVSMEILDKSRLSVSRFTLSAVSNQTYQDGKEICPALLIKDGKTVLTEGIDYRLRYENNRNIGTAGIVIQGIGKYYGERTKTFKITGISISQAKVTDGWKTYFDYDGKEHPQDGMVLKYKNEPLTEGKDYISEYSNNVKAGTVTLTITGINSYTGKIKKTYSIRQFDMTKDALLAEEEQSVKVVSAETVPYEKGGCKPSGEQVRVYYKGGLLEEGKDYTLSYVNNNAVTTELMTEKKLPKITIKGKGNFKGSRTVLFKITPADIGECKDYSLASDVVYRKAKNAFKPTFSIAAPNGKKLAAGTDYERIIKYYAADEIICADGLVIGEGEEIPTTNIIPAGSKIKVFLTGRGNYNGSTLELEYRIVTKSIAGAKVTIPKQYYTGKAVNPEITEVRFSNTEILLQGESYEVVPGSLKNNVNKGTASLTIRGTGNYGGTKKVNFTIANKSILPFRVFGIKNNEEP